MESQELASVTDMGSFVARRIHKQEMSWMREMRATNALRYYDMIYERLRERYGPDAPRALARPILKLVVSEDQQ